jgi:hypothetical protein
LLTQNRRKPQYFAENRLEKLRRAQAAKRRVIARSEKMTGLAAAPAQAS